MVLKLDLNNELITLRKLFGKAQVRTINQITRKLKVIEHGKKKDPNNSKKLDAKAAKLVDEMKIIKGSTNLDMVKKVFVFKDEPDKILKLQKVTSEERAISRLLLHPFLVDAIKAAKKKLDISDEDEEWKKLLFVVGKNKKKKLKKEKLEEAASKTTATEEGKPSLEKKSSSKKKKSKAPKKDGDKPDKVQDGKVDGKDRKHKFDMKRKQFMKAKGGKPPPGDASNADKPKAPKEAPVPKAKPSPSPPKKVNIIKMETDRGDHGRPKNNFGDSKKPRKDFNNDRPRKDFGNSKPRFNNSRPGQDFNKPRGGFNNNRPGQGFNKARGGFNNNRPGQDFNKPRGGFNGGKPNRDFTPKGDRGSSDRPQMNKSKTTGDKVHPSWEAKMQKKPTISEFKGKKMTFDD